MRLVPTAATIWFASDLLLTLDPSADLRRVQLRLDSAWPGLRYAAFRMATEREASGSAAGH